MLAPESVRFPSCVFDATVLMIICGAIFRLELPTMLALSLYLEGLSVLSILFRSPDDICEAKIFLESISSLAYDWEGIVVGLNMHYYNL